MALVAITMPMAPQIIDTMAPTKKAMAVETPYSVRKVMAMNMRREKMMQIRYYCLRNSYEP